MNTVTCDCGTEVDLLINSQCPNCGNFDLPPEGSQPVADTPAAGPRGLVVTVRGGRFTVGEDETVGLGRSADYPHAGYFADCDNVSRVHAVLRYSGGAAFVTDTGSANGTYIDDERLIANVERPIIHGQRLRLAADVTIQLEFPSTRSNPPRDAYTRIDPR
ncbi:FHA domain-containing protein [Gordonia alkanivorans]|uniref:FHA domain-containing protein n=1 Tax=Gordonia alkanivorans TaxID=84096 RepID=UPI001F4DFBC2|nr:FHA domain-containing protein [Gordonia alkanivorans]